MEEKDLKMKLGGEDAAGLEETAVVGGFLFERERIGTARGGHAP